MSAFVYGIGTGQQPVYGDSAKPLDDVAALRALDSSDATLVFIDGIGRGLFYRDSDDVSSTENGTETAPGTIVHSADSATRGVWKRVFDGPWLLQWFGAHGDDSTDERAAILSAFDAAVAAGGATLSSLPGARHRFSGRLRMRPGVNIDLGPAQVGARLIATSDTGGVEQVAGTFLRGYLGITSAAFTGPLLELNDTKSTESIFGRGSRAAGFDVHLQGARTTGSVGLLLDSTDASKGISWVVGRASINEFDYGATATVATNGYVNENWLDLQIFDSIEYLRGLVPSTGEITNNRIRVSTQTSTLARAGRALNWDGRRNQIDIVVWDWTSSRVHASYDGTPIVLTETSGANHVDGYAARGLTESYARMQVIDLAPAIRRNFLRIDDQRAHAMGSRSMPPITYMTNFMNGDQDDALAFAGDRYAVTSGGSTPPDAANLVKPFTPDSNSLAVASCTDFTITIDLGLSRGTTDSSVMGVILSDNAARRPDRIKIEGSSDGVSWTTILQAGYSGEDIPMHIYRADGSGYAYGRYLRLTYENDAARDARVIRWYCNDFAGTRLGGAYAPISAPTFYNSIGIKSGSGTPRIYSGTGTPEGAVTAVVGSLFLRHDGGAGTTLYVKESGTGNTGWVAK